MTGKNNVGKIAAEGERESEGKIAECERWHIAEKGFGIAHRVKF
jgi:hypothetical protein